MKKNLVSLAFILLGVSILALIIWENKMGFAAGTYGGVRLEDQPGLFLFFLSLQAFLGLHFLTLPFRDEFKRLFQNRRRAFSIFLIILTGAQLVVATFCIWAFIELVRLFIVDVAAQSDLTSRIVEGVLALLLLGPIAAAASLWLPPFSEWRGLLRQRLEAIKNGMGG